MANANSIAKLAIQVKYGIMRVSVNIIVHAEKIIVGILVFVFVKMVSI